MALDIWLPLIGNTVNQGTCPVSITASSPAYSTFGKIGEKGLSAGSISISAADANKILNNKEISVAFWIYVNVADGTSRSSPIFGNSAMTPPNNRKFTIFQYPTVNDIHFSWQNNESGTFAGGVWNDVLPSYKWTHVAVTYKNPTGKLFINGELKATITGVSASNSFEFATTIARSDGVNILNDLRVYSHCISNKEVRLLSQGLILDYPLSDKNLESTTNILPYPTPGAAYTNSTWNASLHPDAISVSGWSDGYNGGVTSPGSGYHAYWKMMDGIPTMVFPDLNSRISQKSRWLGISSTTSISASIGASKTYTISFDAKATVEGRSVNIGLYYKLNNADGTVSEAGFKDGQRSIKVTRNWNRYSYTWTTQSNMNNTEGRVYVYGHFDNAAEGITYVRNVQLEVKDHDTAYTTASRTATKVYDCSGYNNNGSVVGSLVTNKDSARNQNCIKFNGSSAIAAGRSAMVTDAITVNMWVYMDSWSSLSSMRMASCTEGGGWNFENVGHFICYANGAYQRASGSLTSLSAGWHMITGTFDGYQAKIYADGVLKASSTALTTKAPITYHASNGIFIGAEAASSATSPTTPYFTGKISDFKIFGTALSASAILDLYQSRTSLLDNGAILTHELVEDGAEYLKFTEDGLIRSGNFSEIGFINNMKTKVLSDGSAWARIFWHDVTDEQTWFTTAEVPFCDASNRFSYMGLVDHFKTNKLPKGYQKLDYIESTGTQYIDTGYYWTSEVTKIYMDANIISNSTSQSLFGNEEPFSGGRYFSIVPHGSNGSYGYYVGSNAPLKSGVSTCTVGTRFNMECTTDANKLFTLKVNDTVKTTDTYSGTVMAYANTTSTASDRGRIYIFANHNSSSGGTAAIQNVGGMRLYAFKMYDNGKIVRDFIPCKNASGTIGLFDMAYQTFYSSPNGTAFTAGAASSANIGGEGVYEFMLTHPRISSSSYNRWIQSSSPNESSVAGFKSITQAWSQANAGIRKNGSSCIYNCDSGSTWYAPIGQTTGWTNSGKTNQIPAANETPTTEIELWVRIDTLSELNKISLMNKKYIQAFKINEI